METDNVKDLLVEVIKKCGEKHPKKHGEWYRLHVYDDNYLLLDTWCDEIFHHAGCEPHDLNNMYRVVYTFSGYKSRVKGHMLKFWYGHVSHKKQLA